MADYIHDRIFASSEAIKIVAKEHGTPFYLYDKKGIQQSIQELQNAFCWVPGYQNYFSIRENNNPHILSLLAQSGTGVTACNYAELLLAQMCGFSCEQLIYEPTRRDPESEELAKQLDATWLINSISLLPEELPSRIILRYHPVEEQLTAVQFSKIGKSKNGISKPNIFDLLSNIHARGVEKLGVALQVSTFSLDPGYWEAKAACLLTLRDTVKEKLGFTLWCIHIGEGPGLPYDPHLNAPTIMEEAERLHRLFATQTQNDLPVIYTGVHRRLLEHNGIMITKILEQRDLYQTTLVLDVGISQYPRAVIKNAYRYISVLGKSETENRKRYYLSGELPDEFDHPANRGRLLPVVTPGDYCVIHDVGCGGRSMTMLYGCSSIAPEFLHEEDGTIRPIAPRRTPKEVLDFLTAW